MLNNVFARHFLILFHVREKQDYILTLHKLLERAPHHAICLLLLHVHYRALEYTGIRICPS
jgi:hypothetical protein